LKNKHKKNKYNNKPAGQNSFNVSKPMSNINTNNKWPLLVTIIAFTLSIVFGLVTFVISKLDIIWAFIILFFIIFISVVFDMLGVSVSAAEEFPFHSLSARKVTGAAHSIKIIRRAPQVASICNDVIGDIAGIISGSSTAAIVTNIILTYPNENGTMVSLILTALVAAATIGGKALCKGIAMKNSNDIVFFMGKIFYYFDITRLLKKNKK